MIAPHESSGWAPPKYSVSGFMFATDDAKFETHMKGAKYEIISKEPVNLCGVDGFWYNFRAEEEDFDCTG